jgi:5,10-methylenetetrahydromethanopterin reductase
VNIRKVDAIRNALKTRDFGKAFGSVSPEMIEAFAVCGSPDSCIEKISQLLRAGISQFVVGSPIGPNVRKSIDLISETIMPHFKR